jgi:trk system potassium uptake protein TrkA
MFVLITGGGRTGTQLANFLITQKHKVQVVEHRRDILSRLHRELPTEVILEGNATDPKVLERAGIRQSQVLAACSPSDADNLVVCYLARNLYGVGRTIARINNPRNSWLFDGKFSVDVALNQSEVMASLIEEEMSLGDMMTLIKLRRGRYSLIEEKIPAGAEAVGLAIMDLQLPDECVIAAIIRHGKVVVPRGTTRLEVGDEVFAIADREGADRLAKLFKPSSN